MKNLKIISLFLGFLFVIEMLIACGPQYITASQVRDRDSLRDFVLAAKDYLENSYENAVVDFRKVNGPWQDEKDVYLYILDDYGKVYFHAIYKFLEQQERLDFQDQNSGKYIKDMVIEAASNRRGGFIRYKLAGRPARIGYAVSFRSRISRISRISRAYERDWIVVGVYIPQR